MRRMTPLSFSFGFGWAAAILLVWCVPAFAQTPNHWGRGLFAEEQPAYLEEVKKREAAYRKTTAGIAALRKQIEDYLGSFLIPGRAAEVERSYENGPYDAFEQKERFDTAKGAARSAEGIYRRHRAEVDAGRANERNASTRGPLWYEHLYWLDLRNQAAERERDMLDSRLIGLRAAAGFDWFEFWADTGDDLTFIFRDVARNFAKEVSECFSDLFRKSLTGAFTKTIGSAPTAFVAPTGPAAIPTLGSLVDVAGCVTGPAMNTWVNALASALKKQFLDDMRGRGVIDDVSLFWWDTLIAADDDAQKGFVESAKKEMFEQDGLMSILKTHTEETAARVLALEERPEIQKALAPLVDAGRLNKAGARTSALQIAEKRGKERVGNLVKGLELGVNLAAKAATLLANSDTYAEIRSNELGKYRNIVECLSKQSRPIDGDNVLPYFRATSTASYVALLTTCRGDAPAGAALPAPPADPPVPAGPGPADATAIVDRVRGQGADAGASIRDALGACDRAKSAGLGVGAAWDNASAALTALRTALSTTPVDLPASAANAEALAREAYAAGEVVSAARTRGLREAALACQAADGLPRATTLAQSAPLRTQAREASTAAGEAAADAIAGLNRARAALASAQQLRTAADSAADLSATVQRAEANASSALDAARQALGAAEAEVQGANDAVARATTIVEGLRNQVNQARGAGYDAATLGLLAAELTRAEDALQAAARCPGEARAGLADETTRAAGIESEAQTLLAAAGSFANGSASIGPETQRIQSSIADAQASFDTADLFADSVRSAAANAAACRARAEAIPDPAPSVSSPGATAAASPDSGRSTVPSGGASPPDPNAGDPASAPPPSRGSGGWTAGATRTTAGTSPSSASAPPPPATGSDPRIPALVSSIQSAAGGCQWIQAADLARQLAAIDPGNPWLAANRANLDDLSMRQRQAAAALDRAAAAVAAGNLGSARNALGQAATVAPSCMSGQVAQVVSQADAAAAAERQRKTADRQRAAGVLAQGLIQLQQALANPPTSLPPAVLPQGANSPAGGGSATGAPVAPDLRTVTCGATTKSGADAPATITVQVQRSGSARFSYNMFDVKDRMIVQQGGRTLVDTGCVSGSRTMDLSISGFGAVVVQVVPACEKKGTQWNFTLECPR